MSNIKTTIGSRTSIGSLGTLANVTYLNVGTWTRSGDSCNDVLIDVEATPGAVSGNKQLVVFAQISVDGTNYSTGPTSGTTTTDEPNLYFLGTVPLGSNSTLQRKAFSLAGALGFIPYSAKIIIKNDSGAALGSGTVYTSEISNPVA